MRMTKNSFLVAILFLGAMACNETNTENKPEAAKDTTAMKAEPSNGFELKLVQNKKDPACGMPVTAGINDTAHYKEQVLGFCSKECKDEFNKNPEALIAAAEMSK